MVAPKAGFSNETFICDIEWTDPAGVTHSDSMVLRIEATEHQLFMTSDALFQARVMRALGEQASLPVPRIRFVEPNLDWFGAAFYLMDRTAGKVPTDVPSYHKKGWVADLSAPERAQMYDNALAKLAQLHCCDWRRSVGFLAPPSGLSPLDAHVERLSRWATWADADLVINRADVMSALDYVRRARPKEPAPVIIWGDARVGNMIFADDLSVAAMLDWESATIGPPGIDLGWWLMFEEYICEAGGLSRLQGIPGRDAIIERYESLTGTPVVDLGYYEVMAALVFSIINSRLATLLREVGYEERSANQFAVRSTGLIQRGLKDVGG